MNRLTKEEFGCLIALMASARSEDKSTKVGCCLEDYDGRLISLGYNGLKSGRTYDPKWHEDRESKLNHTIHAEINTLSLVKRGDAKKAYITSSPCANCCLSLIAYDIKEVVFINEYPRCQKYREILSENGIKWRQLNDTEKLNIKNALLDKLSSFGGLI